MPELDAVFLYERAVEGNRNAQGRLWRRWRSHMHRVIRFKAADLRLAWAVEPDDIYDAFMSDFFNRRVRHFIDASIWPAMSRSVCAARPNENCRQSDISTVSAWKITTEKPLKPR